MTKQHTDEEIRNWYRRAFRGVKAYAILDRTTAAHVANVTIKYPEDGAGRVYVYLHVIGLPLVRGSATGGGYDKAAAAMERAAAAVKEPPPEKIEQVYHCTADRHRRTIRAAMEDRSKEGHIWQDRLQDVGYTVLPVIQY